MLRGGVVAGGMAAFAAGYGETVVKAVKGLAQGTAGAPTAHAVRGNSLTPEFRIDPVSGVLSAQPGQTVSPSSCLGCWTQCGVRLRVDARKTASCAWPAIRIIRWPPRARPPWRRRCARSTRSWAATTAWKAAPRHVRAARPCWNSCTARIACCSRSSASVRAAPASGRPFPSNSWCRKCARAATCSARAMWTACARSTTARRRWIRPTRSTAPRSTSSCSPTRRTRAARR